MEDGILCSSILHSEREVRWTTGSMFLIKVSKRNFRKSILKSPFLKFATEKDPIIFLRKIRISTSVFYGGIAPLLQVTSRSRYTTVQRFMSAWIPDMNSDLFLK